MVHPWSFCWGSWKVDLLWCVRWRRSCSFVICSADRSERTGYFLSGQLVVLAFDAPMAWMGRWLRSRLPWDLEVTSETPVYSMLIYHGEDFLVKLLRLQANQTVCMERSCPISSNMLILQLQLPQSHVPADQLKVGRRCRCWSYGLLRGLVHNPDLFLHNLVSGLFQDVL